MAILPQKSETCQVRNECSSHKTSPLPPSVSANSCQEGSCPSMNFESNYESQDYLADEKLDFKHRTFTKSKFASYLTNKPSESCGNLYSETNSVSNLSDCDSISGEESAELFATGTVNRSRRKRVTNNKTGEHRTVSRRQKSGRQVSFQLAIVYIDNGKQKDVEKGKRDEVQDCSEEISKSVDDDWENLSWRYTLAMSEKENGIRRQNIWSGTLESRPSDACSTSVGRNKSCEELRKLCSLERIRAARERVQDAALQLVEAQLRVQEVQRMQSMEDYTVERREAKEKKESKEVSPRWRTGTAQMLADWLTRRSRTTTTTTKVDRE